jgi:hypothetical protein
VTLLTDELGEYDIELPVGPTSIEVDESTLPCVRSDGCGGSNPTTVSIFLGETTFDSDGFSNLISVTHCRLHQQLIST